MTLPLKTPQPTNTYTLESSSGTTFDFKNISDGTTLPISIIPNNVGNVFGIHRASSTSGTDNLLCDDSGHTWEFPNDSTLDLAMTATATQNKGNSGAVIKGFFDYISDNQPGMVFTRQ